MATIVLVCAAARTLSPPPPWRSAPPSPLSKRLRCGQASIANLCISAQVMQEQSTAAAARAAKPSPTPTPTLTFQSAVQRLQSYWSTHGCCIVPSSNTEVGAGTMNPNTFLRVLGASPWHVAYVEPSVRPDDSRYGDNPNRVQQHTQFQVILKPDPGNAQELYLGSLSALGINTSLHDVRFVEDNWESPVLGAWGLGWEVWLDGMEITQFTYFQQSGGLTLEPVSVEITYGLERILMSLQGVDHFKNISYSEDVSYGQVFLENERQMSCFNLDQANVERLRSLFDIYEAEARELLLLKRLPLPAYSYLLKASHVFNVLDARGEVGVAQRADYFARMRKLAAQCACLWQETLEPPLPPPPPKCLKDQLAAAASRISSPATLAVEIGCEELPPDDVVGAIEQLKTMVPAMLDKLKLEHGPVRVEGTPRRLAVIVQKLAHRQKDKTFQVRGPPVSAAFSSDGTPTKALEGFCRREGISPQDVTKRVDGKAEYVFASVEKKGKHAVHVLAEELLPALLSGIHFPKNMRWNSSRAQFSRPLRWFMVLLGDTVVPFNFAGVDSSRISRVLRTDDPVLVASADDYKAAMQQAGIVLSLEKRRRDIWEASSKLAKSIGGELVAEDETSLLDEVSNLVEKPLPLLGYFDESFLELPAGVLTTVMRKHQRYFPVKNAATGNLLPAFVAVGNGNINQELVQKGNQAVLRARYQDAKFFYDKDTSKPLVSYRSLLDGIVFHEKLGSMLDKSKRVEKLVPELAKLLNLDGDILRTAQEAAVLGNADLATSMVREFTSLAGEMGRHYANRDGYSSQVSQAVFEMLLPRFSSDDLPASDSGRLLSLADKLDNLVSLFPVVGKPTPSSDSFNLRRTAYGLVKVLVQGSKDMDLKKAIEVASAVQPIKVPAAAMDELLLFIIKRLEQLLVDGGASVEFVRAVLAERGRRPTLAAASLAQLEESFKQGKLAKIVEAYSRPVRILKGKELELSFVLDEALFKEDEEAELWSVYKIVAAQLHHDIDVDVFVEASQLLVDPLENFFNKVFVMDKDEALRKNRLVMLQKIAALPSGIVDLSLLPGF